MPHTQTIINTLKSTQASLILWKQSMESRQKRKKHHFFVYWHFAMGHVGKGKRVYHILSKSLAETRNILLGRQWKSPPALPWSHKQWHLSAIADRGTGRRRGSFQIGNNTTRLSRNWGRGHTSDTQCPGYWHILEGVDTTSMCPQSPLANVNVTALSLPLIVDNVNIIRKRINSDQLFIEVITLCPDR